MPDVFPLGAGEVATGEQIEESSLKLVERFLEMLDELRKRNQKKEQEKQSFLEDFSVTWEGKPIRSPRQITREKVEGLAEISMLSPGDVSAKVKNVEIRHKDRLIVEVRDSVVQVNEKVAPGVRFEEPAARNVGEDFRRQAAARSASGKGLDRVARAVERLSPGKEKELLQELLGEIQGMKEDILARNGAAASVEAVKSSEKSPSDSLRDTAKALQELCEKYGSPDGYRGEEYSVARAGKEYSVRAPLRGSLRDRAGEELMAFSPSRFGGVKVQRATEDVDAIAALHLKASALRGDLDAGREPTGAFASAGIAEAVRLTRQLQLTEALAEMGRNGVQEKSQFLTEGFKIVANKQGSVRIDSTDEERGTLFQMEHSKGVSIQKLTDSDLDRLERAVPLLVMEAARNREQRKPEVEVIVAARSPSVKRSAPKKEKGGLEL